MEIRFEMETFLPLLLLCVFCKTTLGNNVSSSEVRHGRVSGRIVKLYSGIKPEPILCPKEGFQADPVDCAVFYRCVKGSNDKYTVFRYQCGPGTVYDPDNEICNHPRSTKRVKCGGYATSLIEPVNENAIDGPRHEVPSPISTKQPLYTEQTPKRRGTMSFSTMRPWSPSSDLKSSESSIVSTAYPWVTTIKQHSKATISTVPHKPNSKMDDMCSSDGFMGDTENCRKFYRCVGNGRGGYIRYEFSCSESTIWDDETQACNHPWAVKKRRCGRGNSDDDENKSPNTMEDNKLNSNRTAVQSQIQISYGSKVNQVQTQIASGPVIQNQTQINYGDRFNEQPSNFKQNQTQISHGAAVSQTQTQISHGNDAVQTQLQIDHTNKSSQSQTQVVKTTTDHTNAMPQEEETKPDDEKPASGNGSNDCVESGFMGDSNDCEKFYRCVDNGRGGYIKYEFSCGEGTVWDRNAEACNHAWAVKDCKNQSPPETSTQVTKTTTTTEPTQHSSTMGTTTSDDEDVGYNNQNQQQTSTSTSNPDKPSTSTQSVTATTSSSTTQKTSNTGDGDTCTSSGFMGDTADCKKFYRCVDNGKGGFTKYEYKCGEGTVWDSEIEACNHAWAVKKCGSTSDASSTEKTTTIDSVPTNTVNSTQTTTEPASSTASTQKPDNSSSQGSDCTSSGFIGDKEDCKKFYRCVDNGNGGYTRYEFACGDGTVWDSKLEACNHVWAVEKCGGKSPDQNNQETTTSHTSNVMQDEEVDSGHPAQGNNNTEKPEQTTISNSVTNTSAEPSSSNEYYCQSSGFKEDKNDCKKFHRCVDDGKGGYIQYDFACGEGTIWDQSIESCNHPSSQNACKVSATATQQNLSETTTQSSPNTQLTTLVDKNENDQDSNNVTTDKPVTNKPISTDRCSMEGFFGDTKDCKKFYRCVDNEQGGFTKYDFVCGEGTMWDSEINACNHAKSGKNECNTPTGSTETTSDSQTNNHGNDENVESTSQVSTSLGTTAESESHQQETGSNNKCDSEGFFASSDNCKKFYRCVNDNKGGYTKYDFTCGEGTIWDQKAQTCNHESSENKCEQTSESTSQDKPQSQPETTTQSDISNESTSKTTPPTSTTSTSNDQCTSEGFYSNSKDCKKFYRCVSNDKGGYTKYDFTCGEGTIWVQEIQACDHDNDIHNCSAQSVSTTTTLQSNKEEQTTTTVSSTAATAQSNDPEKESDEMPNSEGSTESNHCESEGFYPNKHDCRKFYRCVDDGKGGFTMYDFTCGDGTAWDSDIQGCNHINEVKNCQGPENQPQSETSTTGGTSSQTTESTGTTKTTTESSGENKQPMSNDKCEQEGYFGDSSNCQKFYRCVDNGKGGLTKYDYTCGEGTIWDQEILACNHPRDVQNPSCTNTSSATTESSSSASTTTTNSSSTGSESSTSSSTESQGSSNCSQSSTQKPQNKKVNCTKAGFYADPDDCKKFYRCVDWDSNGQRFSVYHFDCGEGTIWDPELETCNHEDSVYPPRDCSGTQAQTQNTTDESTTSTTTTTQKSTTDESTTQESSTTEQSTTEKATTEPTTQTSSTTTEPATTQQATTTESSTTQSSTTTKQTTTQQPATSEKTTTQQSTTSEKTTTQQSTTSEQTTTQQSTTPEQTTTQQATTSEQTTTEQTTTSEQTTTQQSTTSEQTTTQQSTTSEQTTTQQSTTSEQTTTQQSTTSEQTTTEQATTTTTTEQSTTEQSTTETTTSEQTTENSTDQSSTTTEETTTQESSTTEQTTDSTESSTTDTSTTEQSSDSTTTESDQQSTTESSSSASDKCPETEDDQYVYVCPTSFRRHPKYCNMFYQCTEDSDSHNLDIAVFKCPNNTIYDESQTQCVENDKADKKCDGEIAERRRVKRLGTNFKETIVVSKGKLACSARGHFPFEKSECSPGFLKCDHMKSGKLRGYVHQCPKGYVYWSISRRCEVKSNVRDCKLSANDWSGRSEIPIERNNVAK